MENKEKLKTITPKVNHNSFDLITKYKIESYDLIVQLEGHKQQIQLIQQKINENSKKIQVELERAKKV